MSAFLRRLKYLITQLLLKITHKPRTWTVISLLSSFRVKLTDMVGWILFILLSQSLLFFICGGLASLLLQRKNMENSLDCIFRNKLGQVAGLCLRKPGCEPLVWWIFQSVISCGLGLQLCSNSYLMKLSKLSTYVSVLLIIFLPTLSRLARSNIIQM